MVFINTCKFYALINKNSLATFYQVNIIKKYSNIGNALAWHRGMKFSTEDQDNDTAPNGECLSIVCLTVQFIHWSLSSEVI